MPPLPNCVLTAIKISALWNSACTILRISTTKSATPPADQDFDWSEGLRAAQGDADLLKQIFEAFLEELPRLTKAIREAIHEKDARALRAAAHTLKGSSSTFGAVKVADHAYRIERATTVSDFAKAEEALVPLEEAVRTLTPILTEFIRSGRRPETPRRLRILIRFTKPLSDSFGMWWI